MRSWIFLFAKNYIFQFDRDHHTDDPGILCIVMDQEYQSLVSAERHCHDQICSSGSHLSLGHDPLDLGRTGGIAVTALVIIFQPELRKALEQLGSRNLISEIFSLESNQENQGFSDRTVNEIVKATFEMAKVKTGALMVIERKVSLKEIERTGIEINGLVSSQLLINIFEHNTPLHDGAVVIRGNRVTAATCYLPLSDNMTISKDLGTRHRAAVGISEVTDSLTVVVSEETGRVSVVENGKLRRISTAEDLRKVLAVAEDQEESNGTLLKIWKGKRRNERKTDK